MQWLDFVRSATCCNVSSLQCHFIFIAGKRPELPAYYPTQIQIKLNYNNRNNANHENDLLILHTSHKHGTFQPHANP